MKMQKLGRYFFVLAGACFFSGHLCLAQDFREVRQPESVFAELKRSSEKVSSIKADFNEVRHVSYLKDPQKSSGQFFYEKKDKMRWEQNKPSSYIILIEGNSLKVSEQGKEKNVKAAGGMVSLMREMLLMMVNGDFQANKGFEKGLFQNPSSYLVVLNPVDRKLKQRYDKLELLFSKDRLLLTQLTFFEKGGDKQVMTFSNERINGQIAPSLFKQF